MQKPWSILGLKIESCWNLCWFIFILKTKIKHWTIFGSFFEHFWALYWGPFWDQIGQRGGKMSPREPSGASKSQKAAFSKSLKNPQFFSVFGSRGFPRKPQEAREGSQKTPKEIQRWSKTWSKSGQKVNPKLSKKNQFLIAKLSLWPVSALAVFEAMGL